MTKFMASAVAVVLSATATVAMAQSVPSAESRQVATPSAADPAVRAGVMAVFQTAPVHPQGVAKTVQGEQTLSAVGTYTDSGSRSPMLMAEPEPGGK